MLAGDQLASEVAPAHTAAAAPAVAGTPTLSPRAARAARGRGDAQTGGAAARTLAPGTERAADAGRRAGACPAKARSGGAGGAGGSAAAVLERGTPPPVPTVPDAQL